MYELLYLQRWQKTQLQAARSPCELFARRHHAMHDVINILQFCNWRTLLQHALCNSHQCTSTTKLIASGARQIANPQRLQPCSMVDAMYQLQPMKPTSMMKAPQALTCAPLLLPLAQHLMHDTR